MRTGSGQPGAGTKHGEKWTPRRTSPKQERRRGGVAVEHVGDLIEIRSGGRRKIRLPRGHGVAGALRDGDEQEPLGYDSPNYLLVAPVDRRRCGCSRSYHVDYRSSARLRAAALTIRRWRPADGQRSRVAATISTEHARQTALRTAPSVRDLSWTGSSLRGPFFHFGQELAQWHGHWSTGLAGIPSPEHERRRHVRDDLLDRAMTVLIRVF